MNDFKNVFTVCGSSNLLESNNHWNKLKDNFKLSFESHGDYMSPLLNNSESGLIMILFLDDLMPDPEENIDSIKARHTLFFQKLKNKASSSKKPLIVCWGKDSNGNILDNVREDSRRQQFYDWFAEELSQLKNSFETIYLLNISEIFYKLGSNSMFSDRNWYFAKCRLSINGLKTLTDSLFQTLSRYFKAPSKVLVLDCDNTLWGGVIGEDGIKGILLGQDGIGSAFVDFQKEIKRLINKGVVIVLTSKNNEQDVWSVFDNHSEMQLKRENVVTYRINWSEKSLNLKEIAKELDLSLDSFVFWDDNPLERDKMKSFLPQVLTIDTPKNVFDWPRLIKALDCFTKFKITEDDEKKVIQYKARAKFNKDYKSVTNINTYLESINVTPAAISIDDSNILRAEQLCKKTNQFNLSTKRHSVADLQNFKKNNNDFAFLVRLKDDYGDHGIVALVCLRSIDKDTVFIDTFLMSCRVLGRHLEAWILSEIIKRVSKLKGSYVITEFIKTERNSIALEFLNTYGFDKINNNSHLKKSLESLHHQISNNTYYLNIKDVKIPNLEVYKRIQK